VTGRALVTVLPALALGALLVTTSCSDLDDPGKGTVTDELSAIWAELGVGSDEAALQGYGVDRDVDSAACADLDGDDRWIARRSAILPGGIITQDAVIAGLADRYRSAATVRLFRADGGATNAFLAVLDTERRIVVRAHIGGDGRTSVQVRHSPCPVDGLATDIRGPYTETDLPD
jgi:hypothetical protein